jgi:hypothetical protein
MLVQKPEGNNLLGRHKRRWEDNIKILRTCDVDGICVCQVGGYWRIVVNTARRGYFLNRWVVIIFQTGTGQFCGPDIGRFLSHGDCTSGAAVIWIQLQGAPQILEWFLNVLSNYADFLSFFCPLRSSIFLILLSFCLSVFQPNESINRDSSNLLRRSSHLPG